MPEYLPDERILFKHKAEYFIGDITPTSTKVNKSGDFIITTIRVLYVADDGTTSFESTIPNVAKDQYSPKDHPLVMIRITIINQPEVVIFVLTGGDNLRNALEEVKRIFKLIKKPNLTAEPNSLSSSVASSQPNSHIKRSIEDILTSRKKSLLEADMNLKKQFKDLVIEQKIMSEDEFWDSKSWMLDDKATSSAAMKKGRLISLFSDIQRSGDQNNKITITAEIIEDIFNMYPAVKRAYMDKVPEELSEKQFWDRYFQSEYFAQDKAGLNNSLKSGAKSDDIFEKYEQRETGVVNIQQNSKRITVGKDIDLVADAEDHRKSKYTDESNGSSRGGSSNSSNSQSNSLVVNKYNRHSSLCMNDVEQKTFETVLSCGELLEAKKEAYISLSINNNYAVKSKDKKPAEDESTTENTLSAFGRKVFDVPVDNVNFMKSLATSKAFADVYKAFPTTQRAWRIFQDEKDNLIDSKIIFSNSYHTSYLKNSLPNEEVDPSSSALNQAVSEVNYLPEKFQQFTLEAYTEFTELLRHFYAILGRQGAQAPIPGSEAANKILKILKRVDETHERLVNKKNDIGKYDTSSCDSFSRNAQVRCINDILQLRGRAHEVWKQHCIKHQFTLATS